MNVIKNLLAAVGFSVVVYYGYQHYQQYQRLKAENECLRRRWKETAGRSTLHG